MSRLWAVTVDAAAVDATSRAGAAREMSKLAGVLLNTCHRAELYGFGDAPAVDPARVLHGTDAVRHLMRVACGLESVIVGEDEVLHQVREALASAGGADRRVRRLFESVIATGRKARSGRTASSGNLAHRAVEWLQQRAELSGRMVVVAGAGRMGATLAHALAAAGAEVVISSRDAGRAAGLARLYAGKGVDLEEGARLIAGASAAAVALGGPWNELGRVSSKRLPPVADISAPQAVPAAVRLGMNGGFLGIDDLYRQTRPLPGAYMRDAERLVAKATHEYMAWLERNG
ncbi:MAG TPA: NAD(P)-binding domain-containing protein [Candidatus Dormibacteraeota bacterium]|nr:NAD(P)-binding domain-containing protein [Candidatus Dormibacteraeota bacterium]